MRKLGIWIDHRKAVVVTIDEGQESIHVIEGDIERHAGPSGGWRTPTPYGPQVENNERQREEKYHHHVVNFYKDVIKSIGKPDQLLVMGPADAKREFVEELQKTHELRDVPVRVEPADKMTDAQVAAKVRDYEFV
jgi:stalled ribosome rescue protein Dom34